MAVCPDLLEVGPVLALLAVAALCDLRTRRVPNWLTIGGAVIGLGVNIVVAQERGALLSVSGWALGIALLLIPYLFRMMGGGDVKLLGAVGAWGGPSYAFATLFYGALVGGVLSLCVVVWPDCLGSGSMLHVDTSQENPSHGRALPLTSRTKRYLAYAPALALGGLIAYLVG